MNNKRNLPDLFNGLYENCIAQKLNNSEYQLISAILYKFNARYFPDKLEISNTELRGLCNLSPSTFSRSRHSLLRRKSLTGQPYLTYISSDRQDKAGTYSINYDAMTVQRVCNDIATEIPKFEKTIADSLQSDVDFEHDHNITKPTKQNISSSQDEFKLSDKESMICQLIEQLWNYVPQINTKHWDNVQEMSQFPDEAIHEAFAQARKDRVSRNNWFWFMNRLTHPERYGVKVKRKEPEKSICEDAKDFLSDFVNGLALSRKDEVYPAIMVIAESDGKAPEEIFMSFGIPGTLNEYKGE